MFRGLPFQKSSEKSTIDCVRLTRLFKTPETGLGEGANNALLGRTFSLENIVRGHSHGDTVRVTMFRKKSHRTISKHITFICTAYKAWIHVNPAYVGHRQCNRTARLHHRTRWPRHDVTKYFGQYHERAIPVLVQHASIARHVLNACIMYLYLVVCCRSAVPLRPSSGERRTHITSF